MSINIDFEWNFEKLLEQETHFDENRMGKLKYELGVTCCKFRWELRAHIYELRVQIHELRL